MSSKILLPLLKKHRESLDITQQSLADMVGVGPRTIQRIESGSPTSMSTAKAIASVIELPSYEVMADVNTDNKECAPTPEVTVWTSTLKEKLFLAREHILFATILALFICAMIPVPADMMMLVATALFFIPAISMVILTLPHHDEESDKRPASALTWLLTIVSFVTLQVSSIFFMSTSLSQSFGFNRNAVVDAIMSMPGIDVAGVLSGDFLNKAWHLSGLLTFLSLLALYASIRKAKRNGESFGGFSVTYITVSASVAAVGTLLRDTHFFASIKTGSTLSSVVYSIIAWGVIYAVARHFTANEKSARRELKLTMLTVWLSGVASISTLTYWGSLSNHAVLMEIDHKYRIEHCESNSPDDEPLCWTSRLLKEYQLPVTVQNTETLDALNGKLMAIFTLLQDVHVPAEFAEQNRPLPDAFLDLISRAYFSALSNTSDLNAIVLSAKSVLDEPRDHIAWAALAKDDRNEFVRTFPQAPRSVQDDDILSTIYKASVGDWSPSEADGNYQIGMIGTSAQVNQGAVTLDAIMALNSIPWHRYPAGVN